MGQIFTQILLDQKEELEKYKKKEWVHRKQELKLSKFSSLIKIISGVRRSGKSTLVHLALKNKAYAYVNFDDERLWQLPADKLNHLLEAIFQVYPDVKLFFFDEIQNIDGWHLFANRLQRNGYEIVLTGSNSKLLSSELASHLTGRYTLTELLPFSFEEFLKFKKFTFKNSSTKSKASLKGYFEEYIKHGGFPEIIKGADGQSYAKELFNSIVTRDILFRHNIKHKQTFKNVAEFLVYNFSREISYNSIKKHFLLGSEHTAKNYISFLEEAYLIITLPKFSFKKSENIKYRKSYLIDTALAFAFGDNFPQNIGYLYENIVFLKLYRCKTEDNYEIYYYKKNIEVDFVIFKNNKVEELIQVCFSIENEKTFKREVRGLILASKELNAKKLTLITSYKKDTIVEDEKSIEIIPISEWLIQ